MKIGVLGHFAYSTDMCDGQTVKTRNLEMLLSQDNAHEILTVDSYKWRSHPFKFFIDIIKLTRKSDVLIMLPDENGVKVYPFVIRFFIKKKTKLFYDVVGAWLPSFLKRHSLISKLLKQIDGIIVETKTMKNALEEQGFSNVDILVNFKDIKPLTENELVFQETEPLKFCIFSRIMKQKGITDAIEVFNRINTQMGRTVCTLDIYGPVDDDYQEELDVLLTNHSNFVKYLGVKNPNESVEIIKDYYMLLFPTLFFTEGIPGTIIDAFAAGVPILSAEWESCKDILNEKTAVIYKFSDNQDFYEKLFYCVNNISKINELKSNCLNESKNYLTKEIASKVFSMF